MTVSNCLHGVRQTVEIYKNSISVSIFELHKSLFFCLSLISLICIRFGTCVQVVGNLKQSTLLTKEPT